MGVMTETSDWMALVASRRPPNPVSRITISVRAADRIDHGADGAFAVGAGDVNHATPVKIDVELREEPPDVFQTKLDPKALKAVEPGQRLSVVDRCISRCANPRGLARPPRSASASSIHGATAKQLSSR